MLYAERKKKSMVKWELSVRIRFVCSFVCWSIAFHAGKKKHCDLINFKWSEADCKVKLQKPCTFLFDSRWTFQRLWSWQNSFFPFFKFFRISLNLSHSRFLNLIFRVRVCVCVFGVYRKRPFVKISWATNPVQRLNCIINSCIFVDFLPTQTKYFWNSTAGPAITHHQTEQTNERTNVIVYASKKKERRNISIHQIKKRAYP